MKILISIFILFILFPVNHSICAAEEDMDNHEKKIFLIPDNTIESQPKVKRIFQWNNKIIAKVTNIFFLIDIENQKALPVFGPGDRPIVDLSIQPSKKYYALCDGGGYYVLFARKDNDWEYIEVPETLNPDKDKVYLLSDDTNLIILANKCIYRYINGKWKTVKYEPKPWAHKNQPWMFRISEKDHLHIYKDKIFIGHNYGEFGGGLASLDINTGKWEKHFSDIPVTGLAINTKGELWVSQGLAHGFFVTGAVRIYDGKSWRTLTKSEGNHCFNVNEDDNESFTVEDAGYCDVAKENWPYDPADFDSLTFDTHGNLLLLTESYGIVKYQNGKWVKWIDLTDDERISLSSIYALGNDRILVGWYDNGLAVLNISNNTYKSISFGKALY